MTHHSLMDSGDLNFALFQPLLNTGFSLSPANESAAIKLTLIEVSEYPDHRPAELRSSRAPFSLVFACPTVCLSGGNYRLEHDQLGAFVLFLSPFQAFAQGCKLEAVFN